MAAPANNRKQFPVSRAAAPRMDSARHALAPCITTPVTSLPLRRPIRIDQPRRVRRRERAHTRFAPDSVSSPDENRSSISYIRRRFDRLATSRLRFPVALSLNVAETRRACRPDCARFVIRDGSKLAIFYSYKICKRRKWTYSLNLHSSFNIRVDSLTERFFRRNQTRITARIAHNLTPAERGTRTEKPNDKNSTVAPTHGFPSPFDVPIEHF